MIMDCRLSIVIPVYNVEDYLPRCLDSILSQKFSAFEVILVDDGSKDSSSEICDEYSAKDSRFRTLHKKNGGVSAARNSGLHLAKGEYVMFVDSDDALAPDSLSKMFEMTDNGTVDLVVGGFNSYLDTTLTDVYGPDSSGVYKKERIYAFFDNAMNECGELFRGPWAKMYRRSIIAENSISFNESLCYAEDKLFVYSYLSHIDSAAIVQYPVYEYYRRSGSLSWGKTTERRAKQILDMLPHYFDIFKKLLMRYPDSDRLREVYHYDLFCGDLMRVFRIFIKMRTELLNEENLKMMYSMMDADAKLRLFERKVPCQVFCVVLYKMTSIRLSISLYRFLSGIISFIRS